LKAGVFMFAVKGIYDGKSVVGKERKLTDDDIRKKAFDFLMEFPKKSLPDNFDYKQELTNAIREKYDSIN
jgi:hypothetical protein